MDEKLIEDKIHQVIDQFNERKITTSNFYSILLNKIHPFMMDMERLVKYIYKTTCCVWLVSIYK